MIASASAGRRVSVFRSRSGGVLVALVLAGFATLSALLQQARDRRFATDQPAEQILYVQSPAMVKRLALSYGDLAADVYWIRALQHFGQSRIAMGEAVKTPRLSPYEVLFPRLSAAAPFRVNFDVGAGFSLLYPLLDMATTLDPLFNIAYRFGAVFLSEAPPGGPGRPDLAIALLQKGVAAAPERWQYYQDAGFVNYWTRRDYVAAAAWFRRASEIPGSPWFLKSLAANTLAIGGSREASRTLYRAMAESAENEFMRYDSARRLQQLDALDQLDTLHELVRRYRASHGVERMTWDAMIRAGLLRGRPTDPEGLPYLLEPDTGAISLDPRSTLVPLPIEPPAATRPPV